MSTFASSPLRAPARGLAQRVTPRMVLLGGGLLLAEAVFAAAVVSTRLHPLLAIPALAIAAITMRRWPMAWATGALVLAASGVSDQLIQIHAGGATLRGHELILLGLLALSAVAPRRRTWGGVTGGALAIFLAIVGIASLAGVQAGRMSLNDALEWYRNLAPLAFFFVVVRLFPERRQVERLLRIGAILGALTGLMALAVAAGVSFDSLWGTDATNFVDHATAGGSLRVRLPGAALAYATLWFSVVRLLGTRGWARAGWTLVLAGCVADLAMTFNRNMWVGAILGLAVLLVTAGPAFRRPIAIGFAVAVSGLCAGLVVGAGVDQPGSPVAPLLSRGATLFNPSAVTNEASLQDRFSESRSALASFRAHPLTGIGTGAPFGARVAQVVDNRVQQIPQLYLHDQYLYLLVVGGAGALLAFVVFLGGTLRTAVRGLRDPQVLACGVAVLMFAASALVMIAFAAPNMAIALGLIAGVVVARASRSTAIA